MISDNLIENFIGASPYQSFDEIKKMLDDEPLIFHHIKCQHVGVLASFSNPDRRVIHQFMKLGLESVGSDYYHRSHNGSKSIHGFAKHGEEEYLRGALDAGVSVNESNPKRYTPLHHAARNNHKEIVELLIRRGADINALDWQANTAIHVSKDENIVLSLLQAGGDIDLKSVPGHTPLMLRASQGDLNVCRLLIDAGAKINEQSSDGNTPLLHACLYEKNDAVSLLLDAGADTLIPNIRRETIQSIAKQFSEKNPGLQVVYNAFLAKQAMTNIIDRSRPVNRQD